MAAATLISITDAKAQFLKDVSVGLTGGAYIYQGDLAQSFLGSTKTSSFGLSVYAQKTLSNYLSFRLNFSSAKLKGDESVYSSPAYRRQRNFMFTSPLKELSGLVLWNIKGNNYNSYGPTPYLFSGIGVAFINSKPDYSRMDTTVSKIPSMNQNIAVDMAHGTPSVLPVIPLGAGIEFSLSQKLLLNIESAYRFSFSDYIDGFSIAANPDKKDSYYSVTLGVRYRFSAGETNSIGRKGNALGCPVNLY